MQIRLPLCIVTGMQALGETIRVLREERGHGLRRFALRVAVSAPHLSRIERGLANPTPEVIKRIADELGVTVTTIAYHQREPAA